MVEIKGVAHFSIPVSDIEKSTAFYRDIVGCRHLSTTPDKSLSFLDAGGVCVILGRHEPPINPVLDDHGGIHHSFVIDTDAYQAALDHLRANDIEVFFEEDRPPPANFSGRRAYFHDPDRNVIEIIDWTNPTKANPAPQRAAAT